MKREELINKAKELGIKGISRMKKVDLEWNIYLKESVNWFNDIAGNTITITDEEVDISLNEIDLNSVGVKGECPLTNFKMWDIDKHKQMWLIS
jgi:hypothetical protein